MFLVGRGSAPPPSSVVPHHVIVERLVGTLIDVVGTTASDSGHTCSCHSCCGAQVAGRWLRSAVSSSCFTMAAIGAVLIKI